MVNMQSMYTVFGISTEPDEPRVQHSVAMSPYPEDELTDTIAQITLKDNGDRPGELFVRVDGIDEVKATAMWHKVVAGLDPWWWK